jgi:hypothetical protein
VGLLRLNQPQRPQLQSPSIPNLTVIISFTTWLALIKPFLLTMFLIHLTLTAGL